MRRATSFVLAIILFGSSFIAPPFVEAVAADEQAETTAVATPNEAPTVVSIATTTTDEKPALATPIAPKTEPVTTPAEATIPPVVQSASAAVSPPETPPVPLPESPPAPHPPAIIPVSGHDIIISTVSIAAGSIPYIELYNTSSNYVSVGDVTLRMMAIGRPGGGSVV